MQWILLIGITILVGANATYCALNIADDFRGRRRLKGVLGLLGLAGILVPVTLAIWVNLYGS